MPITEYIDWSDVAYERHEAGQGGSKYAELSFWIDEVTDDLVINLRRDTKKKKDFMLMIDAKELYLKLKEHFNEEV